MLRELVKLRSEGELFKKVMGARWQQLHPDIQRRFDKHPSPEKPLKYKGTLDELSCSRWGKFLGYIVPALLPGFLSPGKTRLTHCNVSSDCFRILIEIEHKLFGKMFTQKGTFEEIQS